MKTFGSTVINYYLLFTTSLSKSVATPIASNTAALPQVKEFEPYDPFCTEQKHIASPDQSKVLNNSVNVNNIIYGVITWITFAPAAAAKTEAPMDM